MGAVFPQSNEPIPWYFLSICLENLAEASTEALTLVLTQTLADNLAAGIATALSACEADLIYFR